MKNYLIIIIFLILFSCDITENRPIVIYNNSKNEICTFITSNDINKPQLNSEINLAVNILKNDFGDLNPVRKKWEYYIEN